MCTLLLRLLKQENSVGHLYSVSYITEKKILVSTRTPEEITVKIRCIRRVAKKATISYFISVCQCARSRETVRIPVERLS